MTRDDMNTFLYFSICNQKDGREDDCQPDVRSNDEDERLPLVAIISLILLVLLPLLIMTI